MKYLFLLIAITFGGRPRRWSKEKRSHGRKAPVEIPFDEHLGVLPEVFQTKNELSDITESYRLPRNEKGEPALVPIHYDVDFMTHGLKNVDRDETGFFTFSGTMVVNVTCNKQSEYVVLHTGASEAFLIESVKLDGTKPTSWIKIPEKVRIIN